MGQPPTRRRFLATTGSIGAVGLAGCVYLNDQPTSSDQRMEKEDLNFLLKCRITCDLGFEYDLRGEEEDPLIETATVYGFDVSTQNEKITINREYQEEFFNLKEMGWSGERKENLHGYSNYMTVSGPDKEELWQGSDYIVAEVSTTTGQDVYAGFKPSDIDVPHRDETNTIDLQPHFDRDGAEDVAKEEYNS